MRDCRNHGVTGHCLGGRHEGCAYRTDGALPDGIWLPECYVTLPPRRGRSGTDPFQGRFTDGVVAQFSPGEFAQVVRPSHVYKCPCECHVGGEQLAIFEVAS